MLIEEKKNQVYFLRDLPILVRDDKMCLNRVLPGFTGIDQSGLHPISYFLRRIVVSFNPNHNIVRDGVHLLYSKP